MAKETPNSYRDPFWSNLASATESKLELPKGVLVSLLTNGEKSNNDQVSEAGAKTPFQIIPETRQAAIKKWGIDPYLSAENAAEVAGLLFKDSLQRNKGDVSAAVGEYHGGTNRTNWGPRTNAYIQRVIGGAESVNLDSLKNGFAKWLEQNPAIPATQQQTQPPAAKASPKEDSLNAGFGQWLKMQNGSLVDQIPGPNGEQIISKPQQPQPEPGLIDKAIGAGETALTTVTGLTGGTAGMIAGTVKGIADSVANGTYGTQQGVNQAEQTAVDYAGALTYQPRTATGQQYTAKVGEVLQNAIPLVAVAPELGAITQAAKPSAFQAVQAVKQAGGKALNAGRQAIDGALESMPGAGAARAAGDVAATVEGVGQGNGRLASMGAAGADPAQIARASVSNSTPELVAEVESLIKKKQPINQKALDNHIEAQNLDHPVSLTAGQATEDPILISQEKNARAKNPEYIERTDANNQALTENLNTIRDRSSPDVFLQTPYEHGDALITAYETLDKSLRDNIRGLYKQLENANGGQFPIDAQAFVREAEANLAKKNRNHFLPSEVRNIVDLYKDGAPMSFNDFEELRTILAAEARKAERAGDGNRAMAVGAVRNALEDLPLGQSTDQIKQLADAARTAARTRFAMIENDPAFKAVVNDKASPDNFISKHIINAPANNVEVLLRHLGQDDAARQTLASALMGYLRQNARVTEAGGSFAQAGYNRALGKLQPKLETIFGREDAQRLQSVGNVARLLDQQPKGSFVNNSNTGVMLAGQVADRIPGVKVVKAVVDKVKESKQVKRSLKPGAGLSSKESQLLEIRRKVEAKKAEKAAKKTK